MTRAEAAASVGSVVTAHWPDPYVGVEVRQTGVMEGLDGADAVLSLPHGGRATCPVSQITAGAEVARCEARQLDRKEPNRG